MLIKFISKNTEEQRENVVFAQCHFENVNSTSEKQFHYAHLIVRRRQNRNYCGIKTNKRYHGVCSYSTFRSSKCSFHLQSASEQNQTKNENENTHTKKWAASSSFDTLLSPHLRFLELLKACTFAFFVVDIVCVSNTY